MNKENKNSEFNMLFYGSRFLGSFFKNNKYQNV